MVQKSGEIQYSSSSKAVHSSCCSEKKSQFYIFFNIFFNELWFLSLSFSLRFPKFFLEIQHVKSNIYIYIKGPGSFYIGLIVLVDSK